VRTIGQKKKGKKGKGVGKRLRRQVLVQRGRGLFPVKGVEGNIKIPQNLEMKEG